MHNSSDTYLEEADRILSDAGFEGLGRNPHRAPVDELITEMGELDDTHVEAARAYFAAAVPLGIATPNIKSIRHTHHRLAQMLAIGVNEGVAAKLCNYSITRVSILKSDPAFKELLAYYADNAEDQWADFVSTAANLSMDFLQELQRQLDETPEKFTPSSVMAAIQLLADRTGHAPVSKSVNINVNTDVAQRLRSAQERLRNVTPGLSEL